MLTCKDCRYLHTLYKHPLNKVFKGSILEKSGLYACTIHSEEMEAYIFEEHLVNVERCECFKSKEDE